VRTLLKFALCVVAANCLIASAAAQDVINTVIGGGPNNLPGTNANMYYPYQEAIDASGNIYVASYELSRVFKISTTGVETVVAGNGFFGYGGDGGPAAKAALYAPEGVAIDSASPPNVYIADYGNCLVRKVSQSTGVITTVAGLVNSSGTSGSCGYNGDGTAANKAELYYPVGLAVNPSTTDLYIADYANGVIRKVAGGIATGTISTVAGTPEQNCQGSAPYGDGGTAVAAHLCNPYGVSLDTASPVNLYISEGERCAIREVVGSSKDIYQLAGNYTSGCGYNGDGINAVGAELNSPYQTHVSISGSTTTVAVADYANARVRQFTLTYSSAVPKPGDISTIAGKGEDGWCDDDGGAALSACMGPVGLVYDSSGNFYIGDYGAERVRKVTKSTGLISTIDGWGVGETNYENYSDPAGIKNVAGGTPSLYYPTDVYADPTSSNVYVGGYEGNAVYQWNSSTNTVSGFAGSGVYGFAGDGSPANSAAAELAYPRGLGKDSSGNIYIADYNNCAIREVVASTGDLTTVVGGSPGALKGCGYVNSGAVDSQLDGPYGVAFDSANNMYIADYDNCAIRKLTKSTGLVSTIAGVGPPTGSCGYTGDGGPATSAKIYYPLSVTLDGAGNVYFSEANGSNTCRIREIVAATGIIQTVAGNGSCGYTGDGPAISSSIYSAYVTADPNGNLFLTDYNNQLVRWVTPSGQMVTFAGNYGASAGFTGDGGPALKATFYYPAGIARDSSGNTYVADEYDHRIRQITPFAGYGISTASLSFETQPAGTVSDFQPITVSAIGPTTFTSVTVTSGYSEIDDCAGQSLTTNQTCEIDVYYQPTAAGKTLGTVTIASNAFLAGNPSKVALSGTASGLAVTGPEAFGNVPLKNPLAQTLTLTNSGAAVTLTKTYLTSTTAFSITGGTCPTGSGSLASKASCTIIVTFNPQTVGAFKSTLVVASNDPASPLLAQVTGTGTEVKLSASSIPFGSISFGTTKTIDLTITNAGTASFTLAESISGAGFSISTTGKTCTTSLAAGASCVLPVEYDPTAVSTTANTGTLTLTTNGGSSPAIPLTGTCTSDVSISPTTLPFGSITPATTKVLDVTVSNVGTIASLTVSAAISGTGAAEFSVLTTGNTCTSGVAAGKTCTLPVQFKPAAAASYSATLTITTNGGQNPTVSLTGTGN
jgi:trimeric autotransporter adhesin